MMSQRRFNPSRDSIGLGNSNLSDPCCGRRALSSLDFMYPIFVDHRLSESEPIDSMPGINRLSLTALKEEITEVAGLKIPAVLVFGLPKSKNALGSEAYTD